MELIKARYDQLLTCYESEQIEEKEWQEILKRDEVFKRYVEENYRNRSHDNT